MLTNSPLHAPLRAETRFDMNQEKIDRINFLARKQKAEGLSDEEKAEQAELRREYIESYKRSLTAQLEGITIVEPDGTKRKVQKKNENPADRLRNLKS